MKKRSKLLIDKDFQLKKSFAVTGFMVFVFMLVMVAIGFVIDSNNNKIENNIQQLVRNSISVEEIMGLQQLITIDLSSVPCESESEIDQHRVDSRISDYNQSIGKLRDTVASNEQIAESNKEIVQANRSLIWVVLTILLVGVVPLSFQMIRQTHRISGPIFVMSRHIKETLEGKPIELIGLREKDEFKEFYSLLKVLIEKYIVLNKPHNSKTKEP
ncbi:MAG: hypothetical protein GY786_03820 [Proteobacteria bacterium]|nr:hypothetical protein [Pseudomonadota bacterium]